MQRRTRLTRPPRLAAVAAALALLGSALVMVGPGETATLAALAHWRHAHPLLTQGAVGLTQLGSIWATLVLPLLVAGALAATGRRGAAWRLALVVILGRLLMEAAKTIVHRPRPDDWLRAVPVDSWSFPSGHAMNSMVGWIALAAVLAPPRWRGRALIGAALLAVAIGLTRPLLGVHYPSDVVAGWGLAGLWLVAAWRAGWLRPAFARLGALEA